MYVTSGIIDNAMIHREPRIPSGLANPPPDAVAANIMNSPPVTHTPRSIAAPTHLNRASLQIFVRPDRQKGMLLASGTSLAIRAGSQKYVGRLHGQSHPAPRS